MDGLQRLNDMREERSRRKSAKEGKVARTRVRTCQRVRFFPSSSSIGTSSAFPRTSQFVTQLLSPLLLLCSFFHFLSVVSSPFLHHLTKPRNSLGLSTGITTRHSRSGLYPEALCLFFAPKNNWSVIIFFFFDASQGCTYSGVLLGNLHIP